MKKVKSKVKVVAMTSALAVGIAGFGVSYMTNAEQQIESSESSIQLNVEKLDRDTVKIYLSNFTDLAKSLQLSLKIDEGNVKFIDDQIKWLSNEDEDSEKVKKHYKIDSSKKEIDFFILSDEPINSDGGRIEICEIDVSKDESIVEKLFKFASDGSYKIVPNKGNDEAYSYVTYSTNKRVGGNDIVNASGDKLTINTNPVINFKDSPAVVGDKIIIVKGTVFNIKDYVTAHDADGNEIENIEYTGKVENKKAGSYEIECKVTDSFGDKTTLKITVIVEETAGNLTAPTLSVPQDSVVINVGDSFNPLDGVSAKDYQGRDIEVKVDDKYDTKTEGTYTLTYTATDYRGISASAARTLIVKAASNSGDLPGNGGDTPGDGETVVPDSFEEILDGVNVVDGKGTSTSPYLVDANNLSLEQFVGFTNKLSKFEINIENVRFDYNENYKIADLKLTNKISTTDSENVLRNLSNVYLSIRVQMSNDELLNNLNNFIVQYGGNPNEVEKPGGSGGSSGSGNSGGSDDSNNSGDLNDSGNSSGTGGASEENGSSESNSGTSDGTNGDSNSQAGNNQGNVSINPGNNNVSSNGSGTNNIPDSGMGTVNNNTSNNNLSDSTQAVVGNVGNGTEEAEGQSLESTSDVSEISESASNDDVENSDVQSEDNKDVEKEEASDGDKIVEEVENKSDTSKKTGVIAGIFVGLAAIGASVLYFSKKKKNRH